MNHSTLNNGATVISTSNHGFMISDGTHVVGNPEIAAKLTAERIFKKVAEIKGMPLNSVTFILNQDQLDLLKKLSESYDIVIIPFPILATLREMGVRDNFKNVVAFNATKETQRLPPDQKIVDCMNWSY